MLAKRPYTGPREPRGRMPTADDPTSHVHPSWKPVETLLANALARFRRLSPLLKLAVVVVTLLGLAALLSPNRDEGDQDEVVDDFVGDGPVANGLWTACVAAELDLTKPWGLTGAIHLAKNGRARTAQYNVPCEYDQTLVTFMVVEGEIVDAMSPQR